MRLNVTRTFAAGRVPVFTECLPGVAAVCINVVISLGSNHDALLGGRGLAHWFEHLPSRGTKGIPGGNAHFDRVFYRHGGSRNAFTSKDFTCYEIEAPVSHWREALEHVLDMVANPLLRVKDIEAERTIIEQEIRDTDMTDPYGNFATWGEPLVYGKKHPLGKSICGTIQSLRAADAKKLREAHAKYSWTSATVLFSGDVPPEAVRRRVADFVEKNPLPNYNHRVSFGPTDHRPGTYVRETQVETTFVNRSYLLKGPSRSFSVEDWAAWDLVLAAYSSGDNSPLMEQFREKRQLVYSIEAGIQAYRDATHFYVFAKTNRDDAKKVVKLIDHLPKLRRLRSREQFDLMRDYFRSRFMLEPVHPKLSLEYAMNNLARGLDPMPRTEYIQIMMEVPFKQYLKLLDRLPRLQQVTLISYGRGGRKQMQEQEE